MFNWLFGFNPAKRLVKAQKHALKSSNMFQKAFVKLSKANDHLYKVKEQYLAEMKDLQESLEVAESQVKSNSLVQSKLSEFIPEKIQG